MNDTHDLNRQPSLDPHPYDMPPQERAAYCNGFGAGERKSAVELARLRRINEGLVAHIQEARDLIGSMPTVGVGGQDRFFDVLRVVNKLEAALRAATEPNADAPAAWRAAKAEKDLGWPDDATEKEPT